MANVGTALKQQILHVPQRRQWKPDIHHCHKGSATAVEADLLGVGMV